MLPSLVSWLLILLLLSSASASPTPPVKIVSGVVSNVVSALVKWLWSLQSTTKSSITSSRSMVKFESGYTVETVLDGSKMGIEPYTVEVSPNGQLLVLDSENSNIFKISTPLSRYSRPKLVAGSAEGYTGHVDGKPREARLNHPKGLTVDDRGNVYVADTMNMAIRKISETGVSTIAGGKWGRGGGDHVDGPSEDAKFSNDFDVVYLGTRCSLLVLDRGYQAIREIQLNDEDCSYHNDASFHLGIAMLLAAAFFGFMLALLQRRVRAMFSSQDEQRTQMKRVMPVAPYQKPPRFVRPPLIPPEDESDGQEEGFFGSIGRLFLNTGSSMAGIFGGVLTGFRRKPRHYHQIQQQYHQPNNFSNAWPMQESFVVPDEDEPPLIETRPPSAKRPYPMTSHHVKQSRACYSGCDGEHVHHHKQQQQHHQHSSATPKTYHEKNCETNEIVFGAVQEQDGRREAVVIKAVDYADPVYNHHNIRPRLSYNYMGYSHAY